MKEPVLSLKGEYMTILPREGAIIKAAEHPREPVRAVYFIVKKSPDLSKKDGEYGYKHEVVYVGETVNLSTRLFQHFYGMYGEYNPRNHLVSFIKVQDNGLRKSLEAYYIQELKPKNNSKIPSGLYEQSRLCELYKLERRGDIYREDDESEER